MPEYDHESQLECFENELLLLTDDVRPIVEDILCQADPKFWIAPASSGGKYHPVEARTTGRYDKVIGKEMLIEQGGLVKHTKYAFALAKDALDRYRIFDGSIYRQSVYAAVLLHDICKSGRPWGKYTVRDHGEIAATWMLPIVQNHVDLSTEIGQVMGFALSAIYHHMGRWSAPDTYAKARYASMDAVGSIVKFNINIMCGAVSNVVQEADYYASRTYLQFNL